MDRYKFGEFIYQKRKSLGLTQEEFGRKLGVTNKAVSKWEVGETTPDITILEPLAKLLNVTVDELLTQKEQKIEHAKKAKLNKTLLVFVIVLGVLEIFTILSLIGTIIGFSIYNNANEKKIINYYEEILNKEERFKLDLKNVEDYIKVFPMTNFINDGDKITVYSLIDLNDGYIVKENEIVIDIYYTISYYYVYSDGSDGVVTYYRDANDLILTQNETSKEVIFELEPQTEINDYGYLKNVVVTYNITRVDGELYKNK